MQASKNKTNIIRTLQARSEFLAVQATSTKANITDGHKWVSHGLVIQVKNQNHDHVGVGYTVTKRTNKSAVIRNRIKRRLRSVAAEVLPDHAKMGCDYVLIGRPLTLVRPYEELKSDLLWCLKKMGYARDNS